jgi:hypothetical protein
VALLFSKRPGCQESHLKRLYHNALLQPEAPVTQDMVNAAHQQDLDELANFKEAFVSQVKQAVELKPNTDSDVILKLKEDLDKLYEQCAGLTGNTEDYKKGLQKLTKVVMQAIWAGAGNDTTAQSELSQEEAARTQHYELLEIPLVSHLLRPDSPILPKQLVAVLLGEEVEHVQQILPLFDHEHLVDMKNQAESLLEDKDGNIPGASYAGSILGLLREFTLQVTQH